jgi:ubiquinone/menaquinone biosynthesis C-methylase UbiE
MALPLARNTPGEAAVDHSQESLVARQYDPRAAAYVTSAVHAAGPDLDQIEAFAAARPGARALDLGCGGGHVAYRLAVHAASVVAYDLAPAMLRAVLETAEARGLTNVVAEQGTAERMPFADGSFEIVASRFSAHHWLDLDASLREARRVLAPGGRAIFVDAVSPGPPLLDTLLQSVELLRDPSHGRNYSAAEWGAALTRAGFRVQSTVARRLRMDFAVWTERMATPQVHVAALRSLLGGVADSTRAYFAIEADGSFLLDTIAIETVGA